MAFERAVFLTGFPGFIATRLLKRLARDGGRFLLLVQPALIETAQKELVRITLDNPRSDFRILEGDISRSDVGLSFDDLEIVRAETSILFHLAAIYDLAVSREFAMLVNVAGTRIVNELARSLRNLRHYHYISTCYVAGKRRGRIFETELKHSAGFRNNYEKTKYLAEMEVDSLKSELPITIHRPSVVCGDSRTGETAKYDGIYFLINYLLKWPALLSHFNIGNHDVSLNLVPVDFVVEALVALTQDEGVVGKTLQLADPNPLTTHELFNMIADYLNGRGRRLTVPASLVQFSLMLPPSPMITGLPHHGVPYFFLKQTYDTTQARKLLEPHGVHCPPFASYLQPLVGFASSHPAL